MTGRCVDGREVVVDLYVSGPGKAGTTAQFVLDTGFDGDVVLPSATIVALRLVRSGVRKATVADGTVVLFPAFDAELTWHHGPRPVVVLEAPEALIGMRLVRGSRVTFDAVDGGSLNIEPLPP